MVGRLKRIVFSRGMRRWAAVPILAGAMIWGYGFLQARNSLHEARDALAAQDAESAHASLRSCLRRWPSDLEIRLLAARAARLAEEYEEAEEHLTECEKVAPLSAEVELERQLLTAQTGNGFEFRSIFTHWKTAHPEKYLAAMEALARGYAFTRYEREAKQLIRLILEESPNSVPGMTLYAQFQLDLNNISEALAVGKKIVRTIPDARRPKLFEATVLTTMGRIRDSVRIYETLRQTSPEDTEVLLGLARCRVDLGEWDEAARLLDRLLAASPASVEGLLEKARLDVHRNDPPAARASLQRILAVEPNHAEAFGLLASVLDSEGSRVEAQECRRKKEDAERSLQRLAELALVTESNCNVATLKALAEEYARIGRDAEAVRWYFAVLQQSSGQSAVHRALSECFERMGQPHRARRHREWASGLRESR